MATNIYLQTLAETAHIVLPIFLLMICGYVLRQTELLDDNFIDRASHLVFSLALPVLIFLSIAQADFSQVFNGRQISYVVLAYVFSTLPVYLLARRLLSEPADQGVFVQGTFRGNFAIIGLAVSYNMFGEAGMPATAMLLATCIPLFNLMSIVVLSLPHQRGFKPLQMARSVISNPLIMAVVLALPFSLMHWPLPELALSTGNYLRDLSLPLALLTIGASLQMRHLRSGSAPAFYATGLKILLLTGGAALLGFSGDALAQLFILFGCPTAASAFVMAKVMKGNSQLAANIIALTTLGSMLTLGTGIYLLKLLANGG